jgi:hypothetical protein
MRTGQVFFLGLYVMFYMHDEVSCKNGCSETYLQTPDNGLGLFIFDKISGQSQGQDAVDSGHHFFKIVAVFLGQEIEGMIPFAGGVGYKGDGIVFIASGGLFCGCDLGA